MRPKYPTKRIEIRNPRGVVALVRYGRGRFAHYRVSFQHGAEHWAELCAGVNGPHAVKTFREMVRFYRLSHNGAFRAAVASGRFV